MVAYIPRRDSGSYFYSSTNSNDVEIQYCIYILIQLCVFCAVYFLPDLGVFDRRMPGAVTLLYTGQTHRHTAAAAFCAALIFFIFSFICFLLFFGFSFGVVSLFFPIFPRLPKERLESSIVSPIGSAYIHYEKGNSFPLDVGIYIILYRIQSMQIEKQSIGRHFVRRERRVRLG